MAKRHPGEAIDPIYEYIDEQLNPVKSDLEQLKPKILEIQQALAELMIRVIHNEYIDKKEAQKSTHQFISEITTAINKIRTSDDPLPIAYEFMQKRWDDLKKLGIKTITIFP
jgi:hypothetical protein